MTTQNGSKDKTPYVKKLRSPRSSSEFKEVINLADKTSKLDLKEEKITIKLLTNEDAGD